MLSNGDFVIKTTQRGMVGWKFNDDLELIREEAVADWES
jgi:hypothetical protein